MIRNLFLSAAVAVTAMTGLAVTPATADAHPPVGHEHHHHARFEVLVRHRYHWDRYATYRDHDDARRVARSLRYQGYEVKVERVGGW